MSNLLTPSALEGVIRYMYQPRVRAAALPPGTRGGPAKVLSWACQVLVVAAGWLMAPSGRGR
jgi:hypothetical protein